MLAIEGYVTKLIEVGTLLPIEGYLMTFVVVCILALGVGILLHYLHAPSVVGYILAGLVIGPFGIGLITDQHLISMIGEVGVILLLFFVGSSMSIAEIKKQWKVAIIGSLAQAIFSVFVVLALGNFFDMTLPQMILIGFMITLSSTTVIMKILESQKLVHTRLGKDAMSVAIAQDLSVIPMMIILTVMSQGVQARDLILQGVGLVLVAAFFYWLIRSKNVRFPFKSIIKEDEEFQLLTALVLCFGFGMITGLLKLSIAMGAFIAGVFIATTKDSEWLHGHLVPFKTIFVAFFFISIGMLLDPTFIRQYFWTLVALVVVVFIVNNIGNAILFRLLGESWKHSASMGALHAHVGEFSFVLVGLGLQSGILTDTLYQMTIAVIAITMLLSPFWFKLTARLIQGYLRHQR